MWTLQDPRENAIEIKLRLIINTLLIAIKSQGSILIGSKVKLFGVIAGLKAVT